MAGPPLRHGGNGLNQTAKRSNKIYSRPKAGIHRPGQTATLARRRPALSLAFVCCCVAFFSGSGTAQAQSSRFSSSAAASPTRLLDDPPPAATDTAQPLAQNAPHAFGIIKGTIVDQNGMVVSTATVTLIPAGNSATLHTSVDDDGHFMLSPVPSGAFQLTVTAPGFATVLQNGTLHAGETLMLPDIPLPVGVATTEVRVSMTQEELAEQQIHVEEKQRVLGVIPNFYVSYDTHAVPLTPRQKFQLAWKTNFDPITFLATGAAAGIEQANNTFSGYGQGAQGYAKRYGAGYADGFIGNMLGNALLPALFKQDPRYFYKGTGTTQSRILYAIANSVVCKGDNGKWQFNYSGIAGGIAAGGISNLYYPAANRNGAGLTFENTGIGIGFSAAGNLFQEFLVRKLTPHTHDQP